MQCWTMNLARLSKTVVCVSLQAQGISPNTHTHTITSFARLFFLFAHVSLQVHVGFFIPPCGQYCRVHAVSKVHGPPIYIFQHPSLGCIVQSISDLFLKIIFNFSRNQYLTWVPFNFISSPQNTVQHKHSHPHTGNLVVTSNLIMTSMHKTSLSRNLQT
jgi:hypothetical protein